MFTSKPIKKYNFKLNVLKLEIIIEEYGQDKGTKRKRTDEGEEETIIWHYVNKKPRYK